MKSTCAYPRRLSRALMPTARWLEVRGIFSGGQVKEQLMLQRKCLTCMSEEIYNKRRKIEIDNLMRDTTIPFALEKVFKALNQGGPIGTAATTAYMTSRSLRRRTTRDCVSFRSTRKLVANCHR